MFAVVATLVSVHIDGGRSDVGTVAALAVHIWRTEIRVFVIAETQQCNLLLEVFNNNLKKIWMWSIKSAQTALPTFP